MEEQNFKPVEVIKSFLGIKKGTILTFDYFNGKYQSIEKEEEIGDYFEYYSGNAVSLDPSIVERNLDKYFVIYERPEESIEETVEEVVNESNEELVNSRPYEIESESTDEVELNKEEELKVPETATVLKPFELVFDCGLCHYTTKIADIKYGLFFPATPETSMTLKCENCGISTVISYINPNETTKESK